VRPTALLHPAFAIVVLGIAVTHGARAADVTTFAAHIGDDDYATIQAAVDAALPGDAIRVEPGVWYESVSVTFDDPDDELTIYAKDAVIDGGDAPAIAANGAGWLRLVDGTLRSQATALTASGSDAGDLVLWVDGSTITAVSGALDLQHAIANVYLLDAFAPEGDAIVARDCPAVYLRGHVGGAGGSGVVATRVDSLDLEFLRVEGCGADGIRFRGDRVLMRSCEVRDVGRTGVDLRFSMSCIAEGNSVTDATYRGISLAWRPRADVIVGNNAVTGGVYGIVARGGDGTIRDCRVTGSILDGITWRGTLSRRRVDGRPVGIVSNTITESGRSAIRLEGSGHRLLVNRIELGAAGGRAISGSGRISALHGNTVDGRDLR
jgi:hypothetical protein